MGYVVEIKGVSVQCQTPADVLDLVNGGHVSHVKRAPKVKAAPKPGVRESWERARKEAARTGESPAVARKRLAAAAKKTAKKKTNPPKKARQK